MVWLEALHIDDPILDKIESKHDVAFTEVEEACFSEQRHIRKSTQGLFKVFSQTTAGRYILVVLVDLGGGDWKVVTAREMTQTEKRLYKRR